MDSMTRVTRPAEKPGRLHLAILEWQRQLLAERDARADEQKQPEAA
jgi:hypothetical protein